MKNPKLYYFEIYIKVKKYTINIIKKCIKYKIEMEIIMKIYHNFKYFNRI